MLLPVTTEYVTFWDVTLGIGAVVIAALVALLTFLVLYVKDIDQRVDGVWRMAQIFAANTANAPQLDVLNTNLAEIDAELERRGEAVRAP